MPVTAKLSRQFYERLGDEVTNELVEWLNQVDIAYRGELRELNEANFNRFDAKMEQRFAEFELKIDRRFAEFELKVDRRLAEMDRRITALDAKLDSGFEKIRSEMTPFKAELIKWMCLDWLGTVATTLAITQAIK
jgi:hypothetical protein